MARKMYEDATSKAKEKEVIEKLCRAKELSYKKLPISYGLDYMLFNKDGSVNSIVEVKNRTHSIKKYPTIFVSLLKRERALSLGEASWKNCWFVVNFTDGVYRVNFNRRPDKITWGGRTDRKDSADQEPLVHYRIDRLEQIML